MNQNRAAAQYNPTLENYHKFVQLRDSLPRTIKTYVSHIRLLAEHFGADQSELNEDQVRDYFLYLRTIKNYRPSSMSQAKVAIRVFYHDFLQIDPKWRVFSDLKVIRREKLPNILSRDEVRTLLSDIAEPRIHHYLSLIYACGLRRLEALSIEVTDINSRTGYLFVRNGKGGKQRFVPISPEMIQQLRGWWKTHRHPKLLFPGKGRRYSTRGWVADPAQGWLNLEFENGVHFHPGEDRPMSINLVQEATKRSVTRCGLKKRVTTHTLRAF